MSANLTVGSGSSDFAVESARGFPGPDPDRAPDTNVVSLLGLLSTLLRHVRLLILLPLSLAALIAVVSVLLPHSYSSVSLFTAVGGNSSSSLSRVSGLASQLGITVPTSGSQQSPEFFAAFLTSNEILDSIVTARYAIADGKDSIRGDLTELFRRPRIVEALHIVHPRRAVLVQETVEQLLSRAITIETDDNTGLVTVTVTTRWPELSYAIAAAMVRSADVFTQVSQRTVAEAEARFARERLDTAQVELRRAEDAMETFLLANPRYDSDPQLQFRYDHLNRELLAQQTIYTSMQQDYEQSRISASRDTPTILVVQNPNVPPIPDPRRLLVKGLAGVVLGGLLALLIIFWREFMAAQMGRNRPDAEAFLQLWRARTSPLRRSRRRVT